MTTPATLDGDEVAAATDAEDAEPDDDVVIEATGLTKEYGERVAVNDLDLEVRRGEIFGLLGPNGAGKTTTVLMLLGLTEPTAGEVRVAGFDPRRDPLQVKRRVGYLPDSVGFYGSLTGRENLRYTARLNGIPGKVADPRIEEVLTEVGLRDRADDRADAYSRGMRQRLGIADALVKNPQILILDEPTTAIDPIGVTEILELIRGLARDEGIAILLASHLLDQVQSVCHRVGIFHAGRIIGQGSVDELATEFGEAKDRLEVGVETTDRTAAEVQALLLSVPGVLAADPIEELPGRAAWRLAVDSARGEREVGRDVIDRLLATGARLERFGNSRPSLEQIYRRAVERVVPVTSVERMPTHRSLDEDDAAVEAAAAELAAKRAARAAQGSAPRSTAPKPPQMYRGRRGPRPTQTPTSSGGPVTPSSPGGSSAADAPGASAGLGATTDRDAASNSTGEPK
jgi:ABC-2 type transport system ATP-binding protein